MTPATQSAGAAPGGLGEPQVDFNDVFSLRRPRDARAGLASGLKSIAKGVLGGAAGLVAAPIVGARSEGLAGFAKGLTQGVIGAVVLPVTGVGVGTVQFVRGVINTPEAVVQAQNGKLWDEVPHDASSDQIKKQYYMLARKYHPDKNPGDAGAHERFQKLGEAYQVLGNDEFRKRYDAHGTEGLDVNFMDGGSFFNMLFGSDQFEHLVGELFIAMAARNAGELGSAEMAREQGIRVQKLCVNLKAMLKRYEEGEEAFVAAMREEAARLVRASFGETMLRTIGKVYDTQADINAGGFFSGMAAKFRSHGENMRSQFQAASAAIKVYQAQQKIEAWQKQQDRKAAAASAATAATAATAAAVDSAAAAAAAPVASSTEAVGATGPPTTSAQSTANGSAADAATADGPTAGATADGTSPTTGGSSTAATAPPAAGPTMEQLMERQKLEEAALPLMLEAMWAANVLDIQNTLKKVCQFVLTEEGVQKQELQQRANALKVLGGIFMEAKAPEAAIQTDARKQMEEAMLRVVEKRAAQEGGAAAQEAGADQ
ncbi:molecular chaperone [Volvox carteri f. nagariensis]|uniref:Molecular chaperone n=1 Tax=Volvox carteri f. nagariensis TaxID=3068 RepID=D8TI23_VOLCA|nr:molecular chaperone [Volvox carteri f. nagariensis]EFJ53165.1 molecular chaperone [Volvox carteri f. nagariensis]|eukprot:XP_002946170.1 molecular chaperone [Volvox carteri f. nagariensis]